MAGELTGTARAYTRCGECGHARQRHRRTGTGSCVQVIMIEMAAVMGQSSLWPFPCYCQCFIEPPESE